VKTCADLATPFFLFVNEEMQERIVNATNDHCCKTAVADWKFLTVPEFRAFLGLLIAMGANLCRNENLRHLWSDECGIGLFKATMSRNRFQDILRFIRFEYEDTVMSEREKGYRISHILWLWNMFVANVQTMFEPGENLTLDEMLSLFRGRTFLKVFIKSKPGKYGFKIVLLSDAEHRYICNASLFVPRGQSNSMAPSASICRGGTPVKEQVNNML